MKKWQVKEDKNIADVMIEIFGKNEKELFQNLLTGFASIITNPKKLKEKEKFSFKMTAFTFEELVFNFVEELIYLKDTKAVIFKKGKFVFKKDTKFNLEAVLWGEKISEALPIKIDIKAITRHKFEVKKEKNKLKVIIVFDV